MAYYRADVCRLHSIVDHLGISEQMDDATRQEREAGTRRC